MKKLFTYLVGIVALAGAFTACNVKEAEEAAALGLNIKVFSPTKVVAGSQMTISGNGFSTATEVVFPEAVSVTTFKVVSDGMIRVTVPSGIAAEGGNIIVRSADDEAVSRLPMTVGNPTITGYSKQPGESIQGGELLTIYGKDLEFITSVELLDADGNPVTIPDSQFYRKGTSTVIIIVPKQVYEGTFTGKVNTVDGKTFNMPELAYEPAAEGGHWEKVKKPFWTNEDPEGNGAVSWSGTYRFALEGHDGNDECIAEFPQAIWDRIKTETFYIRYTAADPTQYQVRVTNGWWDTQWLGKDNDVAPWANTELITDNEDGTFTIEVTLGNDPLVETLDEKHLLLTGSGFTPLSLSFEEEEWVEGGGEGHMELVKTILWKNEDPEGNGAVSWSGTYRFALEGNDGNNECIAEFPADVWNTIKTETFYIRYTAADPTQYQVRVTNGWWDVQWLGKDNDVAPWANTELITDNEDGTFSIEVTLGDDPLVETLDEKHLLITGSGFTPLEIYTVKEEWVGGGGGGPKEVDFWVNDGGPAVSWSGDYRFALEGHDGNNECIAEFPEDVWNKIKTGTFYLKYTAADPTQYQVRVTNGWWDVQWLGKDNDVAPWANAELITDNEDGTFTIVITLGDDPLVETLDEKHLLLTGSGYTPVKLFFLE